MDRCIGSNLWRECQRGNWVGLALTGVHTADHSAQLSPVNKKVAIKGGKCRLSLMQ